ncbi:hypothetical protein D3C72_676240 [compost metagenome]
MSSLRVRAYELPKSNNLWGCPNVWKSIHNMTCDKSNHMGAQGAQVLKIVVALQARSGRLFRQLIY